MNKQQISITNVKISALKSAVYNPRKYSRERLDQLKASVQRFGVVDPILVNSAPKRMNIVIGGHMRLKVAKELGYEEVPVVYLNISDLEKEKELNLRLNKNTGEWNLELLKAFNADFLLDIGFTNLDLSDIWDDYLKVEDDDFDEKKELAKIKTPATKLGDIITLGKHKIICGDSNDPKVLQRLFGNDRASMVYSDSPYNIKLDYNKGIGGKRQYGGDVQDNRTDKEFEEFLRKNMRSAMTVTNPNCHWFYWSSQLYVWLIQILYREMHIDNKAICIWAKGAHNPVPTIAFNRSYEPVTYGTQGRPYLAQRVQNLNEFLNKDIGTGNAFFDDLNDIWAVKRLSGRDMEHATSKPPELHHKAILRCTRPGDLILDSFLGSGSTLIAAEQLKRRVYGVELEPVFCDLIIKRFKKLTGIEANVERK